MKLPAIPEDEQQRTRALHRLRLLDTPAEERFDRVTRLAQTHFDVPIALVSLVDSKRQWFKSRQGLLAKETPRDISFCGHAILGDEVFVIPDALADERFADNPLVTGTPKIRFYAGAPLHAPTGERIGSMCIVDHQPREMSDEDVATLRSLADIVEGELSNGEERVRAIVDMAVDGIITTDETGRVETYNPAASRIFGYDLDEALGKSVDMLMPPPSGNERTDFFSQYAKDGSANKHSNSREVTGRRKDGSTFPMEMSISAMSVGGRRLFTGIVRDITERKRAEHALLAAKDAALLANHAKDTFLATTSHEIRTPLGGLISMLELLSLSKLDAEQAETLQSARDSARGLLRTLDDLLDWSKIEEGKMELAEQPTSLGTLLSDVVNTYSRVASAHGLVLEKKIDRHLGPAHVVDPLRLSQVLNNYVSNALKFTDPGGRVEVRADLLERQEGAEQVRFSVVDNGIGIDAETQKRLFRNYGQGNATTARMYGGTGLGLAICQRLAGLMGGRISVISAPGEGSTFSITFTLPVAAAVTEKPRVNISAPVAPLIHAGEKADRPAILVVDDHPTNRRILARQLSVLGLPSHMAENGETALPMWRQGNYSLVITDCHMPEMDGYALARAIRQIEADEGRPRTPILGWTANALPIEKENCKEAGMDDMLVKPVAVHLLRDALATWLKAAPKKGDASQAAATAAATTVAAIPAQRPSLPPSPPPSQPDTPSVPVDVAVLASLIGDDPAVLRECLKEFRTNTMKIAVELCTACVAGETAAASEAAHKLKSSARSVGALTLGNLCGDIEQAHRTGRIEKMSVLLPQFRTEVAAVERWLEAF